MVFSRKSIEKEVDIEQIEASAEYRNSVPEVLRHYSQDELATLEKKLVRKIDFRALPILIVLFLLNILDRNAIANARLGGLEASLGIDDVQYQTAVMVLWAGYISMMVPSNMLLSIFKPRIYLPTVVIIWGIVSGATGFVQNFAGLVALRFLVGVTEAPYFPGCIFFLSCWYTRKELPSRIATFYSGYTLSSAFGGLIAAGIVDGMEGLGGYPYVLRGFYARDVLTSFPKILEMDLHHRGSLDDRPGFRWVPASSKLSFKYPLPIGRGDRHGSMETQP